MTQPDEDPIEALRREVLTLQERLREAEETLDAIRQGEVDAVVVSGLDNVPRVYTLETADESYRLLVQEMQEGALTLNEHGDILYCNAPVAELLGIEQGRIIGGSLRRFIAPEAWADIHDMIHGEGKGEINVVAEQGRLVPAHVSFSALRGAALGGVEVFCCIITDLTEQRRTSDQLRSAHEALLLQVAEREKTERLLRQSQKMEAVGQLTGGIAHDFNNLLMVISGGLSILDRNPSPERRQKLHDGMKVAAERGAALTRQLLAFSRQQELQPQAIEIAQHVGGMRELLDGSLGGDVTVLTAFDPDVWTIQADEGELGIALLNLCVNARDAMPKGGTITIAARNRPQLRDLDLAGDFVEISVTDSGEGMDAETLARCLEPFYTTKDVGKGSGLGLAQVYGFVRGSKGTVYLESKLQHGTTVSLLLPRFVSGVESAAAVDGNAAGLSSGVRTCRVLLVEDDAAVASLTVDMLEEIGFGVTRVPAAQEGLEVLARQTDIGLIMSDVMMPGGMDGLSFVEEVRRRKIGLPILLVSGYAEAVRNQADVMDIVLLAKPYSLDDLSRTLTAVLNKHSG